MNHYFDASAYWVQANHRPIITRSEDGSGDTLTHIASPTKLKIMSTTKYRLLQSYRTPTVVINAGTIGTRQIAPTGNGKTKPFTDIFHFTDSNGSPHPFFEQTLKDNRDWFEEVKPEDVSIGVTSLYRNAFEVTVRNFKGTRDSLKSIIEKALNP